MSVSYKKTMESLIKGYLQTGCKFYESPDNCTKYEMACQCPWTTEEQVSKRCYVTRE